MINNRRRMLCPQRSKFHQTCQNDVLQFQLELYLRFLEIIYDSVLNDVDYCSQNLLCNLYYIWGFANKYFSEKDIQFELLLKYFFSICDFIEKSKNIRPSLSYEALFCEPYILYLQCKFSVTNLSFLKQLDLENKKLELQ